MNSGRSETLHFEVEAGDLGDQILPARHSTKQVRVALESRYPILTIEEVGEIASGEYVGSYSSEGVPYIRVDNIRSYVADLNPSDLARISPGVVRSRDRTIAAERDVLLARTGTLGKASLSEGPIVGAALSQHITRVRVTSDSILPAYLCGVLNSTLGKFQLNSNAFGTTRPELTHESLGKVVVPILPDSDQSRVAHLVEPALRGYYESCALLDRAIDTYETATILAESCEPPPRWFEVRNLHDDQWTPGFFRPDVSRAVARLSEGFHCERLGELCSVERGKGTLVSEYVPEGIPFIRTTSLINHGTDPFPDHFASETTYESFDQETREKDILVSIEGKVGEVAILSEEERCVFKNHIERVRPRSDVDPIHLFLFLSSRLCRSDLQRRTVVQSTIPGLGSRLRDVMFPLTPRREATRHHDSLTQATHLVTKGLSKRAQAIRDLRHVQALLGEAFGRIGI